MKVLVLGGVAAGTKVAAKLKREDQSAEVTIITKGEDISYAGCGLPYYLSHTIESRDSLIVNTPESFSALTGVKVLNNTEALSVNVESKEVKASDGQSYGYDKLVIATGARAIVPDIPGKDLKNVYTVRTVDDVLRLREFLETSGVKKAMVVGAGYIGLEVAENLNKMGIRPFVLERAPYILQPGFDEEMAEYIKDKLVEAGIPVVNNVTVTAIEGNEKVEKLITDKKAYKTDIVIFCAGIRANTEFLNDTGLKMDRGLIETDEYGMTNLEDIYAVGDCALVKNRVTGRMVYSPMGSTANIVGRIVAENISGHKKSYHGVLGTAVCKLAGFNVARTGLSEKQARDLGYDVISSLIVANDKAHYYPDADSFVIKLVADKSDERLLGLQVIGKGAVDKVNDIGVTAISLKAKVSDLCDMDLSYAPPFSTAIHPFAVAINVLMNKMNGSYESMTPYEYMHGEAEGYTIIDTTQGASISGTRYVELTKVDGPVEGLEKDDKLLLVCDKGRKAYLLQNKLKSYGYTNTKVLEGGITFNGVEGE